MVRIALFTTLLIGLCAAVYYFYMTPTSPNGAAEPALFEPQPLPESIGSTATQPSAKLVERAVEPDAPALGNLPSNSNTATAKLNAASKVASSREVQAGIEDLLLDKSGGAVRARTAVHIIVDSDGFSNLVSQLDFHADSSPNTIMYEESLEESFRNLNNEVDNATILYDDFACTENMCIGQVRIYGNDESYQLDNISAKILSSINEQEEYSNTSVVSHVEDRLDHQLMNYIINFPSVGDAPTIVMENSVNQELKFVDDSVAAPANKKQ